MGDAELVGDLSRLIAFDLDGTLIDSRRDLAESANELIRELGGTLLSEEAIGAMVGEGAALLVRRALDAAGLPQSAGALDRFLEVYAVHLLDHTRLYPGIDATIRRARNRARLAVLTNKPTGLSDRLLQAFNVRQLFDDVVGSDGPFPRKPNPDALLALMQAAGATRDRTLVVGDSAIDHETAHRAQVPCCLVSYGFGFRTVQLERLRSGDSVVDDAAGLMRVVDRFLGPADDERGTVEPRVG